MFVRGMFLNAEMDVKGRKRKNTPIRWLRLKKAAKLDPASKMIREELKKVESQLAEASVSWAGCIFVIFWMANWHLRRLRRKSKRIYLGGNFFNKGNKKNPVGRAGYVTYGYHDAFVLYCGAFLIIFNKQFQKFIISSLLSHICRTAQIKCAPGFVSLVFIINQDYLLGVQIQSMGHFFVPCFWDVFLYSFFLECSFALLVILLNLSLHSTRISERTVNKVRNLPGSSLAWMRLWQTHNVF